MDRTQWLKVQEIVCHALETDPSERTAYLVRVCKRDTALLASCQTILRAHLDAENFLETPMSHHLPELLEAEKVFHEHPRSIGPYEIVKCLGQGGMGAVYLARKRTRDAPDVALKIIRPGSGFPNEPHRFAMECRILAQMNHPNIARIFEANATEDGRPYFTMEYCNGLTLNAFCRKHELRFHQRLHLFLQICRGVHYAHRKGIIHRDLKPANVMAMWRGDEPVAKIIDFGIAGHVEDADSDCVSTRRRNQEVLGTPAYMSPEQASASDLDARTDIYSLGVILYELIKGTPPACGSADDSGVRRSWPYGFELEPSLTYGCSNCMRHRRHDGELVRIALKAMAKNRTRRFRTAWDLALEIEKHLTWRIVPFRVLSRASHAFHFSSVGPQ